MVHPISDDEYARIYGQVIRMCVDLVIYNNKGELFLTLRDIEPYKGLWHLPGGGIRFKESLEDAATRIAKREFGVGVRITHHVGLCETINDDLGPSTPRHSNSIVVVAEMTSGTAIATAESKDVGYFAELPTAMHPYHRAFIKTYGIL